MPQTAAKGLDFGKKIGPLPLGVWLAGGIGIIWYIRKQQASSGSGAPAATTSQTGYGTDPAGNTGYIDPSTATCTAAAEDIAALQSQGLVGANSYNTGGTGATSGTGASGSSIGASGPGTPDTSAGGSTTGVQAPGTGTSVTTPPATTTPVKVASPAAAAPKSNNWRYPAPTGLQAYAVSDSGYSIRWNPVQGPNGQKPSTYTVATYTAGGTEGGPVHAAVNEHEGIRVRREGPEAIDAVSHAGVGERRPAGPPQCVDRGDDEGEGAEMSNEEVQAMLRDASVLEDERIRRIEAALVRIESKIEAFEQAIGPVLANPGKLLTKMFAAKG